MSIISNLSHDMEFSDTDLELDVDLDTGIDLEANWNKAARADVKSHDRLRGGAADDFNRSSISSVDLDEDEETLTPKKKKQRKYFKWLKIALLVCLWILFTVFLLIEHVHETGRNHYICVPSAQVKIFTVPELAKTGMFFINIRGPFVVIARGEATSKSLSIKIQELSKGATKDISDTWIVYLENMNNFDTSRLVERSHFFQLKNPKSGDKVVQVHLSTNVNSAVSLELRYEPSPIAVQTGLVIAMLLIAGLYLLLMFDVVHRALAIVLFCTLSISMLALMQLRPALRTIVGWINFEILLLIFGFTLIIAILSETGVIDYVTMRIYEVSNGHIWPMLNTLCLITFVGSSFFDNIVMVLLVAPIAIRVCEVMELNPVPLLTCVMISANVGATLTPYGETPNDYVTKNEFLQREGVTELVFLMHVAPGSIFSAAMAYIYMRIQYHNSNSMRFKDGAEVERLRRVIKVWARTAKSISAYSRDEKVMRDTVNSKVRRLRRRMKRLGKMPAPAADYAETLKALKEQYQINDRPLLIKCFLALLFAAILIGLHLFPDVHYLSTAWTALLACLMLLILADTDDFDGILGRIEWSSMLFLACFLVFTEATTNMGVFDAMSRWTSQLIVKCAPSSRLCVAIIIMVWFSAICAAFLTDTAVGAMMLRAVIVSVNEVDRDLPVQPLLWAVVLGTSLGSIGTIVGSFSNVVCAGLAEKHGYNFPFLYYCKVGFPIMVLCVCSATVYLLFAHVLLHWH